jgi:hypothetical protein
MLEEELRIRDDGLGAAVDGVEAMRIDRASMRDASLAALERLSMAEQQLKDAVADKNDIEYRLGEEILVLEQQLKQASTFLDIEKSAHAGLYFHGPRSLLLGKAPLCRATTHCGARQQCMRSECPINFQTARRVSIKP